VLDGCPRWRKAVRIYMAAALLAFGAGGAVAQEQPEEPADREWRPKAERRILERLNESTGLTMRCDFVLNAQPDAAPFTAAIAGRTTVLNFWRPSCGPCKPLLKELAAFFRTAPGDVAVLAAAEGGSLYGERIDAVKAREVISRIVKQYGVPFPVCGYTDHSQTKRWQAEGVPLTLILDRNGRVGRVAMGAVEASSVLKQLEAGWRP
jgi:thiol-disulfide isomerase/thioredoxin